MKRTRRSLCMLLALCIVLTLLPLTALADEEIGGSGVCGAEGGNLTWTLDSNGTLTIDGSGAMANYTDHYHDSPTPWQSQCEHITTVVIGNDVTSIGDYAFHNCKIQTITIPNKVSSIGDHAFQECDLQTITIPGSVTSIGKAAFHGCISLESITIQDGVTSIGNNAFTYCINLTEVTIPDSVTSIGDRAFEACFDLTEITIPGSVISIGDWAFDLCSYLTSITIQDGVTSIGDGVFGGCSGLTSITIPNSVTSIGDGAFGGCSGLQNFIVDSGNLNYKSIDGVLFSKDETSLISYPNGRNERYIIPDSVTSIGNSAFAFCGLTKITIPDSVTTIGNSAFFNCDGLTNITIPGSVTSIEDYTFYQCHGLSSITIPESVTSIGYVFHECSNLTDVYYGGSKTKWLKAGGPDQINDGATAIHYGPSTVTYDANGGTGEMANVKIEEGRTYTLPSCGFTAPENQKFKTWSIGQTEYAPGDTYVILDDTTVTAVWEDVEEQPGPAVSDTIKDQLDVALDATVDDIKNLLECLNKVEIKNAIEALGDEIFNRIEELEKRIDGSAEIDVAAGLGFAEANIKIVGAKLNSSYAENVRLEIRPPEDNGIVIPNQDQAATFRFSMKLLEGESNNIMELQVPIRITLPIPNLTTRPKNFTIWHKHGNELSPVTITTQPFQENNQWYVSFKVSGFSDFVMSYELDTDDPASDSSGSSGGGGSSKPSIRPGSGTPNSPATTPSGGVAGFNDVAASAWYADAVQYVVDKGLFGGVGGGNFAPNDNMTRAMMWTVLARYMGVDTSSGANWYALAQEWAIAQGISDGTQANGSVTREQFVTMLWRLSGEPAAPNSASFTDGGSVSGYARTAVDWAVAQGIVNGYNDGAFKPQGSASRAEVAKMLTVFCSNAEGQG